MVEIVVKVNGTSKVAENLSRAASKLRDRRIPNRAIGVKLHQWFTDNFDRDGGKVGGWPPLAASTIARKKRFGKEKMLVISGRLKNSFVQFSDNDRVGIGSEVPYSKFHQEGTKRLPRRELLPRRADVEDIGLKVYNFYVSRIAAEANR